MRPRQRVLLLLAVGVYVFVGVGFHRLNVACIAARTPERNTSSDVVLHVAAWPGLLAAQAIGGVSCKGGVIAT